VGEVLTMSRSILKYTNLENGQVPLSIPPTANVFFFLKSVRFYLTFKLTVTSIFLMMAVKLFCATVSN